MFQSGSNITRAGLRSRSACVHALAHLLCLGMQGKAESKQAECNDRHVNRNQFGAVDGEVTALLVMNNTNHSGCGDQTTGNPMAPLNVCTSDTRTWISARERTTRSLAVRDNPRARGQLMPQIQVFSGLSPGDKRISISALEVAGALGIGRPGNLLTRQAARSRSLASTNRLRALATLPSLDTTSSRVTAAFSFAPCFL